jgi:hypothetical protein
MPLTRHSPALPAALGLALGLGACAAPGLDAGAGVGAWAPLSANRNQVVGDSLTIQRVRGASPEVAAILPEPGNVWPAPEAERPTLMSGPEEAMRNIPEFRPSLPDPQAGSRPPVQGMPPRTGSGGAAEFMPPPTPPQRIPAQPGLPATPPAPRAEGQVITDPRGRPAVVTGQAGNVRGVTQPGVGGGAVIRDGNVETWIGPDGVARTRVVPQ